MSRPRPAIPFASGSHRDRGARVLDFDGRIYRAMSAEASAAWSPIAAQPYYQRLVSQGAVIDSRVVAEDNPERPLVPSWTAMLLEHPRVPFVSYPYEWCFGMLQSAAILQLQILTEAVPAGSLLKDASPYNVQFQGCRPVFIDVASFAPRAADEPWAGYRQFCELQLFPLLLQAHRGIDFQPLLRSELEGLPAERMVRWFSLGDLFRPGVLTHVWLHSWLRQAVDQPAGETQRSLARSGLSTEHVLRNLAGLTRLVSQLRWTPPRTTWTGYDESLPHVAADRAAKQQFVRQVCGQRPRRLVWDLGCNTGDYSRIAAAFADTVIAMDQDHGCVERLYRRLVTDGPGNILPLRIDLASPSPALGWRGRERLRLESRGQPDLVLCLGLIHHLVIAGNVPLDDVVDWLAELGGEVILEFPDKSDAQVQSLLSGKPDQYDDYCWEELQAQLELRFQLADCVTLPSGSRRLLHAVPLT